jgi:hypothetical protein
MSRFNEDGISFSYPDNWRLEREENADGWTVSLQSPGTAFLVCRLDRSLPTPEHVLETTLKAMRSDYPELEAEPTIDMLGGEMALGHDMNFFSLDVSNSCWTRSLYSEAGTLLLLWQVSDIEEEVYEPVLRAVCASLRVAE